ncbi:MAG: alpha/beta hydrolase [Sphingomonadaceae bacterium]|nr:alpha/beta hydrolase [Sphingomonadaceae bacterium]
MRRLIVLSTLVLAACGLPKTPGAEDEKRDGLTRSSYAVPGTGLTVSMIARGPIDAPRVIFVHGTPGSALAFEHYVAHPPAGVEAIAVDRPGFGQSRPTDAVVSLKTQAAAIAPLLVARDGKWPILVGHSLGGPVVAQVAADNPGHVGGLLILAGSFDPGVEKILTVQRVGEWRLIAGMIPTALRNANRELIALKPELEALAPRLEGLRCRVTIVHGTADTNVPYSNAAFLKAHLTHAAGVEIVTLPGVNHFIPWSHEPVIRDALAKLITAGGPPC